MSGSATMRQLFQQHAKCWAATCKEEIARSRIVPPIRELESGLKIPSIMEGFYNDIYQRLLKNQSDELVPMFMPLSTSLIVQDFTDKDNMTSMAFLMSVGSVQPDTNIALVGKEQWMLLNDVLLNDGERVPHYNILSSSMVPGKFRTTQLGRTPDEIAADPNLNIGLDFAGPFDGHWPNFTEAAKYTFRYNEPGTHAQYELQKENLRKCLEETDPAWKKVKFGSRSIARTGMTFFNELLYFPTTNTMLQALDLLEGGKFLSDMELEQKDAI